MFDVAAIFMIAKSNNTLKLYRTLNTELLLTLFITTMLFQLIKQAQYMYTELLSTWFIIHNNEYEYEYAYN